MALLGMSLDGLNSTGISPVHLTSPLSCTVVYTAVLIMSHTALCLSSAPR